MHNYQSVVQQVLAGYVSPVVTLAQEEEGKAQLTRAAAWQIYQSNPNIGLVAKDSGNQVLGLTVDVLMDRTDGSAADMASSTPDAPGYVRITTPWSPYPANHDPAWLGKWRQPTQELAQYPGPMVPAHAPEPPEPEPPPGPQPPDPMPPMPVDWSSAPRLSLEWYSEGGHSLNDVYLNLLWRDADPGGWGNWWYWIVEQSWTVAQVSAEIMNSDEYKILHGIPVN
jgi:hypothetical protein